MMPEWLNPPGVYTPQAHYTQVARAGNLLFISGQLGLDARGELVGPGDPQAQARQAWHNLVAILAHYGATVQNLTKINTYITHWAYRQPVSAARDEFFSGPAYPPSTLVVVQGLSEPRFLVEIEATAIIE